MKKRNMIVKIKPNDNWFMNTGRPFEKRQEGWLESAIFPAPSVFYGALFSSLIFQNSGMLNEMENTDLEEYQKTRLAIENIYLYDEEQKDIYIKAPLDLYIDEDKKVYEYGEFEEIQDIEGNIFGKGIQIMHPPHNDYYSYERADEYYIKLSKILGSYANHMENLELKKADYFINNSYKVGIEIDRENNTAKDGFLYRLDFKEFKKREFSFLLEINMSKDIKFNEKGAIKLGGEGKTAYYNVVYDESDESMENKNKIPYDIRKFAEEYNKTKIQGAKFKMIFLSPLVIEQDKKTESLLKCEVNEDIEILGGVIGKPEYIGGFDIKRGKPKATQRAIPKGSVYVGRLKNDDLKLEDIEDKIKKYFDTYEDYKGYGKFLIVPVKGEY